MNHLENPKSVIQKKNTQKKTCSECVAMSSGDISKTAIIRIHAVAIIQYSPRLKDIKYLRADFTSTICKLFRDYSASLVEQTIIRKTGFVCSVLVAMPAVAFFQSKLNECFVEQRRVLRLSQINGVQ